jgi:hypothetical protein
LRAWLDLIRLAPFFSIVGLFPFSIVGLFPFSIVGLFPFSIVGLFPFEREHNRVIWPIRGAFVEKRFSTAAFIESEN